MHTYIYIHIMPAAFWAGRAARPEEDGAAEARRDAPLEALKACDNCVTVVRRSIISISISDNG